MFDKPSDGCIRTQKHDDGRWSAWTEGLPMAFTVQGHPTDAKAQVALVEEVRRVVQELQSFLKFPAVNPPERK